VLIIDNLISTSLYFGLFLWFCNLFNVASFNIFIG
jgi:hypothetical protein